MWTHVVHYLGMGVHDPCTMNYMEVYGDEWQVGVRRYVKMAANVLISMQLSIEFNGGVVLA